MVSTFFFKNAEEQNDIWDEFLENRQLKMMLTYDSGSEDDEENQRTLNRKPEVEYYIFLKNGSPSRSLAGHSIPVL